MHRAYANVQTDPDEADFCGAIASTNNTGELSAIPHAIYRVMRWKRVNRRRLNLRSHDRVHVIMVYDSEYAHHNATASIHEDLPEKNTTMVRMVRRLMKEAATEGIQMHWVKVRGHSRNVGNDAADKAATWGQNGGSKNVENLQECMEWLLASTQVQAEDDAHANADVDADDDVDADASDADAVNGADTGETEY